MKTLDLKTIIKSLELQSENPFIFDHLEHNFMADNKEDYNRATKAIDAIKAKGTNWNLYAWYDVSGFEYWHKQSEPNYICITIEITKDTLTKSEVSAIAKALDKALSKADEIQTTHKPIFNF